MISQRQQHCLQGIGVRRWLDRDAVETAAVAESISDPVVETTPAPAVHSGGIQADVTIEQSVPTIRPPDTAIEEPPQPPSKPVHFEIPTLDNWDSINSSIEACTACELAQNCTRKVPGIGNRQADLLIVGEGPGHDEDLRGEPFVGRSGQLLDRMLNAIGLQRDRVYITNIVKCRPPNNRDPRIEEAQQCRVYLDAQIKQLAPKVILSVGRVSAHHLLGSNLPVGKLIRQMHQLPETDIPLKVTYHPAYLLRTPSAKEIAWQDMKLLHRLLQ